MSRDTTDLDVKLAAAIELTKGEIDGAREVVRQLANELADVVEVVEPIIADHTKRIRQARMSSLDEMRQIVSAVKELREIMGAGSTEKALVQAERFLRVCRELEEFRIVGFVDAFVAAFSHGDKAAV